MKKLLLLSLIMVLPVAAEVVTFDKKFTITFPDGWKKSEKPQKGTLVFRESKDGDASFAVAKLPVPKDSKVDLKATLKAMTDGMKKTMKFSKEPLTTEGKVDGKKALFSRVGVKSGESKIGFFIIAIDAGDRVIMLQATLPTGASEKSRGDCMKIIQSFKELRE
ncbi:MAG: PsbP-related protein [Akkermansiaceae bacterium]